MAFIQNLFTSRDNNADSATNVGQQGRLWWDPVTNRFYVSDGVTSGGIPVGGSGNVTTDRLVNGNYQLILNADGSVTAPGSLVAAGNISANYFIGNGSQLSSITGANVTGQVGNALVATLAVTAGTVSANAQPNITSVGVLSQITVTGNVTGGNLVTAGIITSTGNIVSGANAVVSGYVTATGNVTANFFLGNGSLLTGLVSSYNNASVQTFLGSGTLSGNIVPAGNGIVNLGTPTARFGAVYLAGNTIYLGASQISANATAVVITNPAGADFVLQGTLNNNEVSASGNVVGANLVTAGLITAAGNITGNYILGNGSQLTGLGATYSNAEVVTLMAAFGSNTVSTTGNITAGYFLGNGSQLTGLPATYGNANVAAYLPTYTGNLVALTGNVITTANISGSYILGNGSQLTSLPTGGAITVLNQGNVLSTTANSLNFIGNGVSSSATGNSITVDIAGASNFLPPQAGNVGNVLSTNGTITLWKNVAFGLVIDGGNALGQV